MPFYNYVCDECGHEFTEMLSMAQRNEPVERPCPNEQCQKVAVRQFIGNITIQYGLTKQNGSEFKQAIKKIKDGHPLNTIPDKY